MSEISTIVGHRIRDRRKKLGMTQEELAHLSGCSYNYIGQLERGEKNATVKKLAQISRALDYPLSELFEQVEGLTDTKEKKEKNIPLRCYEILCSKPEKEQKKLLHLILELENYNN